MKVKSILLVFATLFLINCSEMEQKESLKELEPFYGTYQGSAINIARGEISERDLSVVIKPGETKGFTVEWSTVIHRASGEKANNHSINFRRTARPGIFASTMTTNVFGESVPYDPLDKEKHPYVWAGLKDNTLTVTALYIVDGGEYEMQVYKRTLQADAMELEFERLKNGAPITQVSAKLIPVK